MEKVRKVCKEPETWVVPVCHAEVLVLLYQSSALCGGGDFDCSGKAARNDRC